jgi:hypothetical protein
MAKLTVVGLTDILRPARPTAQERWQADMCWALKAPYRVAGGDDTCPVWGDRVPWKSVTVIVEASEEDAAAYCLSMAHGAGWSRRKVLDDGRVALRSDYAAW